MKKRVPFILTIYWTFVVCLAFWASFPRQASAYQETTPTSEPLPTETAQTEETPSPVINTAEETPSPIINIAEETSFPVINTAEATPSQEAAIIQEEITETTTSINPPTEPSLEEKPAAEPIPQPHEPLPSGNYAPDEVLVRFRKSASGEDIQQCLSLSGAEAVSTIEELNVWVVQVSPDRVAEAVTLISSCPAVRYAEPNYTMSIADTIPSDPDWGQYGLLNINAPQGWDYSTGSASVTIAILDSGVDLGHPDLASKIVPGYDFVNDDPIPQDDNGHGTHAAGIAAAIGNNGIGVAGVSWGARIMPVKILNAGGGGFFVDAADGIIWATDHGAQIINLSLGGTSPSVVLEDAVNYAYGKGVLLVAAAGNDNGAIRYPARYPNVIAVGAVDSLNNRAGTSNYGPELDLAAPGVNIYSTVIGGYNSDSGTSMAAPYVSGLAAILYGIPGNGSSALVTSQMQSSARDLGPSGFDVEYGYGLIQMDSALKMALPPAVTPTRESSPSLFSMPGAPTFILSTTNTHTPTAFPTVTTTFTPPPAVIQPTDSAVPPEVEALSVQRESRSRAQGLPSWQLPCAGAAFLLAGLLLAWTARKKR